MTPDQITETYEVLAPMATDYANANLERAGQAQASYGPLAQAAMGDSQTAGIGNYTYNRLVRPTVDTLRDQLIVEGYSAALNKQLSNALNQAKQNYSRAARGYSSGRSGGSSTPSANTSFTIEDEVVDGNIDANGNQIPQRPNVEDYISSGYDFSNYGNLPGQTGQYPYTVDTPTYSTSYYNYSKSSDPIQRAKDWVNYLYSIGYGG